MVMALMLMNNPEETAATKTTTVLNIPATIATFTVVILYSLVVQLLLPERMTKKLQVHAKSISARYRSD